MRGMGTTLAQNTVVWAKAVWLSLFFLPKSRKNDPRGRVRQGNEEAGCKVETVLHPDRIGRNTIYNLG